MKKTGVFWSWQPLHEVPAPYRFTNRREAEFMQ